MESYLLGWLPFCCQTLHPSVQTKPGVIRPMTAIPRLTVEDEEEYYPNPFRQSGIKETFTDNKKVFFILWGRNLCLFMFSNPHSFSFSLSDTKTSKFVFFVSLTLLMGFKMWPLKQKWRPSILPVTQVTRLDFCQSVSKYIHRKCTKEKKERKLLVACVSK